MDIKTIVDNSYAVGMHQHRREFEPFLEWAVARGPINNVLEIGMLHGGTAAAFHAVSTGKVISIDLPNGDFGGAHHLLDIERCSQRNRILREKYPRLIPIMGDSRHFLTITQVSQLLDEETIDLLFIDGDHRYESVLSDYSAYAQIVRPGGLIAFHDINPTEFHSINGVEVPALWKMMQGEKHEFTINEPWGGIGVVIKE